MPENPAQIKPLPAEVAAQIKSSTAIPSLSSVVLGLVANSLDAGARKVDISVDFGRGSCVVEDDANGIPSSEFGENGGLGKPYHTSKRNSLARAHGCNGTFLSSLAALSILSITSHYQGHRSHNTLILHHSRPAARLVPAPPHHYLSNRVHGTRVSVQDLFGSMPVRVKQRREDGKEWELLKRCIVGLLLAWDPVTAVSMRDVAVTKKLHVRGIAAVQASQDNISGKPHKTSSFDLRKIVSILSQAAYVEPSNQDTWVKTSARTLLMTIRGAFSLVPAPTKHVQFISLGIRPLDPEVGGSILYDEINRIFSASSFGSLEDCSDADERAKDRRSKDRRYKQDGFTKKQLKGGGKGIDKWPMFYIRIELQDASRFQYRSERAFLEGGSTLSSILEVLGVMITGFLKEYHFRPRARLLRRPPTDVGDHPSSSSRTGSTSASKRPSSRANTQSGDIDEGPETISRSTSHPSIHLVESKGGSTIGRPKSSVTKDLLSSIDTFGGSIKIPSFSQRKSYHSGEGLTSWSRIKSGKRYISDGTSLQLDSAKYTTRSETAILKPSTEGEGVDPLMNDGPGTTGAAHSLIPSCDDQPMTTGNESDPFVEECPITARGDQTIGDSTQHATAANGLNSRDDDGGPATATNETTIWTNPISKEQVL
ncbi:DNA mismatch repair protein, partial [Hypocenomyce scalaris]|nr:DNA mismatch repair protein [Hypocenomyce scalaris]